MLLGHRKFARFCSQSLQCKVKKKRGGGGGRGIKGPLKDLHVFQFWDTYISTFALFYFLLRIGLRVHPYLKCLFGVLMRQGIHCE